MRPSRRFCTILATVFAACILAMPAASAWESNNHKWGEGKETKRFSWQSGNPRTVTLSGCTTNAAKGFNSAHIELWLDVSLRPDTRQTTWNNTCNRSSGGGLARGQHYLKLKSLVHGSTLTIKKLTIS